MIRGLAFTISVTTHVVLWLVLHLGQETSGAPATPESISSTIVAAPEPVQAVEATPPPVELEQHDVEQETISYTAKRVTVPTPSTPESPSGDAAAADPVEPDMAAADDLDRDTGLPVPQLRIIGLQAESIDRLIALKLARIVVFVEDLPAYFVDGPLAAPKRIERIADQQQLAGYSERMLQIATGQASGALRLVQEQDDRAPGTVRLALRGRFDQMLRNAQLQAAGTAGRPVKLTIGRLQWMPEGVQLTVERME